MASNKYLTSVTDGNSTQPKEVDTTNIKKQIPSLVVQQPRKQTLPSNEKLTSLIQQEVQYYYEMMLLD